MEKRIQIEQVEPDAYKGMFALESYLNKGKFSSTHKELIKIRASQINGCAFCIDMHTKEALKKGETLQRIFLLNAWNETDLFSEEEKVLLKMTEEVTLIHKGGLSSDTYNKALSLFGENYLSQIIMAVVAINAWNRISISTNKPIPEE
ncbi:MAG: carboxymuconolactone decarboxylase family protein [Cyclobacteriaceae bacterium]